MSSGGTGRPAGRPGGAPRRSGGSQITSLRNPVVQAARRLARPASRPAGRFLVEGARGVRAAVDARAPLESLLVTAAARARHGALVTAAASLGARVLEVSDPVMAGLADTPAPQGLVAVARSVTRPLAALPPAPELVCVLDQVRDPGNAGTVLRAADAAGADALITTAGSVRMEHPKVARAAAGSLFHLPVVDGRPWPEVAAACRERGLVLLGADARADVGADQAPLEAPCALVLGNEAHGLGARVRAGCDLLVSLPMHGRAESLNLAAAAAVLLYEAARRKAAARAAAGAGDG
jgi:TrmH family RNA methyltransferase